MSRARAKPPERWWLYLVECRGGRLYCGIARKPRARFAQHAAGKGAKFTRAFGAQKLLAMRRCASRSAALKAEYALKQLTRPQKQAWALHYRVD
ncbi:MAG TPA: GIY-YIG nuclease family protein [Candidatus Binatia bacterium]|nr:GIY-YIG nuclease family protein [Candidatus Binatia bacterium]